MIEVRETLDVSHARREAARLCAGAGLNRVDTECVVLSVSELAHNLVQHGGGGRLTVSVEEGAPPCVVVQAEDEGPGIADLARVMEDGYSTTGGLGSGLPGVKRLMDEFEITSAPGQGTRVVARKWA